MAKKRKIQLQKRDWAIIVLFVALTMTNFIQYPIVKTNEQNLKVEGSSWLSHQVQINKLKACIDEGMKPCDITPPQ